MSRKLVQNVIDNYQRARLCFVQTVSSFADKAATLEILQDLGILDLLMPLLNDKVSSIQHAALATLGKMLCAKNLNMSREMSDRDLLRTVLRDLSGQNKYYKRTALHMINCAVQYMASGVMIQDDDLNSIIRCLQDMDPDTRASAALAVGSLARYNEAMAERVVQCGALPALTQILASPELALKRGAANALSNIAKHNVSLAENVADCDVIPLLVKAIHNDDARVKSDAFLCLANIAKHSPSLATLVADSATVQAVEHLTYRHGLVQKHAASLLRDICRHNLRLANMVVVAQGLTGLVGLVQCNNDCSALPAIMALGYMAAQSEQIAEQIIELDGVYALHGVLQCEDKEQLQVGAAWTLGQIGKHSEDNVKALSADNVLSTLLSKIGQPDVSDNLRSKCESALRMLIPKCEDTTELENMLLGNVSEELLSVILSSFAKILPCYPQARLSFYKSQCLRKVQEIEPSADNAPYIETINGCFPPDVVRFVSPDYFEQLLDSLDQFVPKEIANMPHCKDSTSSTKQPGSVQSVATEVSIADIAAEYNDPHRDSYINSREN